MFNIETIRKSIISFWDEQLVFAAEKDALHIAYPLLLPDGWQVAFSVYFDPVNQIYELSDNRSTFKYLEQYFSVQTEINKRIIEEKCKFYELNITSRGCIQKLFTRELPPMQIQLFAEGLLALHYLIYRFEKRNIFDNQPLETVRNIFISNHVNVESDIILHGKHHPRIHADFKSGFAIFRVVNHTKPLDIIEITGFRFNDYKMAEHRAKRVLIYNPDRGWDSNCQALADSKDYFEFSSPYFDTQRISHFVKKSCAKIDSN